MGVKVQVAGYPFHLADYSVVEASSPLAGNDSSGQVGTIDFTLQPVDEQSDLTPGWELVRSFGPDYLIGETVTLTDSDRGFTVGTVRASGFQDSGLVTVSCESRLGLLNAYNIQAQPFIGTLREAYDYYVGLAGIDTGVFVDDAIADREVVFPGWSGELWYYLKQMAIAQDCEISLVSGVILLRAIRTRIATSGRDISRSVSRNIGTLAQAIEIYQYSNTEITDELVYPPGGWTPETQVLNVNAGEVQEYQLSLSASVSSIDPPEMLESVGPGYSSSSVYTVIANDGLPVSEAQWTAGGGSVQVSINPDTTSLTVRLRGATGIETSEGEEAINFALALTSDETSSLYSTLRIVGTGVAFTKTKHQIRTGVTATQASTDVGVTLDNPFISTVNDRCRAGVRAAKQFAGPQATLSGNVVAINRRGDSGAASYPTYGDVKDALNAELTSPTYSDVGTYYSGFEDPTYEGIREYWFSTVQDEFANQLYGNAAGARVYDRKTRRWYRVRSATITPAGISVNAEDDLIHGDMEGLYSGMTYGEVTTMLTGLNYRRVEMAGMYSDS